MRDRDKIKRMCVLEAELEACVSRERASRSPETLTPLAEAARRDLSRFTISINYRQASADRNRRKGGSQSISKCAREIGRTVSQFLNVYGQVSQFLKTKCTEIGPDAYTVGRRVPIYTL